MAKLNGFESHLAINGLIKVGEEIKADIQETIRRGKNPLMTEGYVDMVVNDAINKIKLFTLKK